MPDSTTAATAPAAEATPEKLIAAIEVFGEQFATEAEALIQQFAERKNPRDVGVRRYLRVSLAGLAWRLEGLIYAGSLDRPLGPNWSADIWRIKGQSEDLDEFVLDHFRDPFAGFIVDDEDAVGSGHSAFTFLMEELLGLAGRIRHAGPGGPSFRAG